MPSVSKAQHRFMEMVAHDPAAAKRVGVSQSVGKDFADADKKGRYNKLPERKADAPKKKGWLKGGKGEKKLKAKLSQKPSKTEDQRMKSRYGE
jgi:hypothetical protein